MVANAPSRHSALAHAENEGERFIENLQPWRRRLWIQQILLWTEYGIIISTICACFLLLISRIIPWSTSTYWAIGSTIGILLCAIGAALWYRPSFSRSAHYIDSQLALHDRMSTALELRHNSTPISVMQRRDAIRQLRKHAPANASSSLQNSSNANVSNTGKALASGDSKALNSALQNFAAQIAHMTPAQRAQLAQQIERAANQGQNNPQLSSALHQLAKAVADGNPSEISDATKTLESAASQDRVNQASNDSINQASQSLQNAANALASSTDNSTGQSAGQTQNPGQGQNPGQTKAPGNGQRISAQSGQNNSNNKSGKNEQVSV